MFFGRSKANKANKNLQQRTLSGSITIPLFNYDGTGLVKGGGGKKCRSIESGVGTLLVL